MLRKILLLITISLAILCADTKIYIGTENDQLIFGIDSMIAGADSAGGLEIRSYAKKKGLLVEGYEYGAKSAKTVYTLTGGGKITDGTFLIYQHRTSSAEDEILTPHTVQFGIGQGNRILSH